MQAGWTKTARAREEQEGCLFLRRLAACNLIINQGTSHAGRGRCKHYVSDVSYVSQKIPNDQNPDKNSVLQNLSSNRHRPSPRKGHVSYARFVIVLCSEHNQIILEQIKPI